MSAASGFYECGGSSNVDKVTASLFRYDAAQKKYVPLGSPQVAQLDAATGRWSTKFTGLSATPDPTHPDQATATGEVSGTTSTVSATPVDFTIVNSGGDGTDCPRR
jgi:hypothetical protein